MLHLTLIAEDTILTATRDLPKMPAEPGANDKWRVRICDALSGQEDHRDWSDAELGAVVALCIGSDEIPGNGDLYPVAEIACKGLPRELRPMP